MPQRVRAPSLTSGPGIGSLTACMQREPARAVGWEAQRGGEAARLHAEASGASVGRLEDAIFHPARAVRPKSSIEQQPDVSLASSIEPHTHTERGAGCVGVRDVRRCAKWGRRGSSGWCRKRRTHQVWWPHVHYSADWPILHAAVGIATKRRRMGLTPTPTRGKACKPADVSGRRQINRSPELFGKFAGLLVNTRNPIQPPTPREIGCTLSGVMPATHAVCCACY